MLLAELKKQRVSRDDIHKTFENAAYSYMVEERCYYHSELGISHCAVARCYAAAKLLAAYLNQLYVPERPASTLMSGKRPLSSSMDKSGRSSVIPVNTMLNREPPSQPPPPPPPVIIRYTKKHPYRPIISATNCFQGPHRSSPYIQSVFDHWHQ